MNVFENIHWCEFSKNLVVHNEICVYLMYDACANLVHSPCAHEGHLLMKNDWVWIWISRLFLYCCQMMHKTKIYFLDLYDSKSLNPFSIGMTLSLGAYLSVPACNSSFQRWYTAQQSHLKFVLLRGIFISFNLISLTR